MAFLLQQAFLINLLTKKKEKIRKTIIDETCGRNIALDNMLIDFIFKGLTNSFTSYGRKAWGKEGAMEEVVYRGSLLRLKVIDCQRMLLFFN